jgi:hypothetical protein
LLVGRTRDQAGKATVNWKSFLNQNGIASINAPVPKTISGKANIKNANYKGHTGTARIGGAAKTQPGKANIRQGSQKHWWNRLFDWWDLST